MSREVKLSEVDSVLEELSSPVSSEDAADAFDDVPLLLADGETNLGDAIGRADDGAFDSADELENSVYDVLPRAAVGEPYQSEGEGRARHSDVDLRRQSRGRISAPVSRTDFDS